MVILSASGMRGIVGDELDPHYILKIVKAFLKLIQNGQCVVGHDSRPSSVMLSEVIIAELLYENNDVHNLGMITTPALSQYLRDKAIPGGMMITASHNPPNWNGVKFFFKDGRGPNRVENRELVENMERLSSKNSVVSDGVYGSVLEEPTIPYTDAIVTYVGRNSCKGIKVALDIGGGSGYSLLPTIFSEIGCKVILVNSEPGDFRRELDPTVDALSELSKVVIEKECDVGFAYDCDGDRVVVVDNKGVKMSSDATLFMTVNYLSSFGGIKKVIVSVDTTSAVENEVSALDRQVIYSKVGEANVVHELLKHQGSIGGEGSSAGVIIPEVSFCRDGILTSALLSRALGERHSLQSLVSGLSKYHRIRRKLSCSPKKAVEIVEHLTKSEKNVDLTDGVKIKISNGSWVLVRPSGTEPVLRISVEASSQEEAESLMSRYLDLFLKLGL
jgi:phosphomannomutase